MMFIPYVCCGDPSIGFTRKLVKALAPYSTIIELGIPFSDPIADGKTIQAAANRALNNGANINKIFAMVKQLRKENVRTPFVFMTYYNIVYSYNLEKFLKKMREVGVQGIIIPDLPFNEDKTFERLARKSKISIINLIAPTTDNKRAKRILSSAKSNKLFTYLVSTAGTTGASDKVSADSLSFVKKTRSLAGKQRKLCVGFGVSNAQQAQQFVNAGADGVIVGSKLINIYSRHIKKDFKINEKAIDEVKRFAASMNSSNVPV